MVNDIRARTGKAYVRICTSLQAFIHETDANSELQRLTRQNTRTELHFRHKYWLDRESSYKTPSQLALDLVASPASQVYEQQGNGTELGCPL